jgi:integrase
MLSSGLCGHRLLHPVQPERLERPHASLDRAGLSLASLPECRRTKATLIYRRTKNLRAVQLLLGHSKLESTVRYLGIEVDDTLEISEQTEI